ncbi:MAG: SCP2 sterol-binding domain-containing protein [Trueperaceae bacterium]
MTAKELLKKMPEALKPEVTKDMKAVIQFDLSEPVYQVLENGTLHVHEGMADHPDLTVKMSDENFVKLFKGELNSAMALMTGKIKLKGDINLAQQLVDLVDESKLTA